MHLKHNDKRYHIQFLKKDYDTHNVSSHLTNNRHLLQTERVIPKTIESLFSADDSTVHGLSSETMVSNTNHESKRFNQNLFNYLSKNVFYSSFSTIIINCIKRISPDCFTQTNISSKTIINY